jgi:peptidoglycan/LPS O-acetylase OafA/YrhL
MAVEALSLAVAATLHLSGLVHGHSKPFDADAAGVAEAIISIVVAAGALALLRRTSRARRIGLATTSFAIAGFAVGLTMTTQGGDLPDIAYHCTVLPLLIASMILLARTDHTAFRPCGGGS